MRHIGVSKYEQHLAQCAGEVLKQMTELKQLRELVRLAEANRLLLRSPINPKIVDPLTQAQLGNQPARLLATTGPSL